MKDSIMKYSEAMGRWPSDYFPAARLGGWIINSRGDASPYHSRFHQFIASETLFSDKFKESSDHTKNDMKKKIVEM